MADTSRAKSTLFVGGLDNSVTQDLLYQYFIPFGEIVEVTLPKPDLPSATEPHRGFGYVEFDDTDDAKEAMFNMDQSEIFGRVIRVAAAKPQKDANEGLGSKTAIWEQEGYVAQHAAPDEDGSEDKVDPMQGLEGLDVAGPKAA